ncbi:MAG TPA: type II secretion system F family protein [Pirellulaceae bacterium]|nr:type II secretion system F family protein [Pirellulaceae bacterium]
MDPRLVTFLSFVAIALFAAAFFLFIRDVVIRRRELIATRLRGENPQLEELPRLSTAVESPPATSFLGRINQWFERLENENGTDQSPDAVVLWEVFIGLLVGGALYLWQQQVILAVVGFLVGMMAVTLYFVYRRNVRRRQIQEQLPEVMEILARAVRAGETLDQAIALVGDTIEEPLRNEFVRCSKHLDMGLSLEASIRSLTRRAPLPETRILAAALMVQRRAGGSLPVTLERLARVVRDRLSYQRQFRAATAAGRISMVMILLAGPLVLTYMWFWQRHYIETFLSTPQGYFMIIIAVTLQIIGSLWVFSLLKSDY